MRNENDKDFKICGDLFYNMGLVSEIDFEEYYIFELVKEVIFLILGINLLKEKNVKGNFLMCLELVLSLMCIDVFRRK